MMLHTDPADGFANKVPVCRGHEGKRGVGHRTGFILPPEKTWYWEGWFVYLYELRGSDPRMLHSLRRAACCKCAIEGTAVMQEQILKKSAIVAERKSKQSKDSNVKGRRSRGSREARSKTKEKKKEEKEEDEKPRRRMEVLVIKNPGKRRAFKFKCSDNKIYRINPVFSIAKADEDTKLKQHDRFLFYFE
ncbi:unnamed protein product, partial [Mesorhabditis spiculigera]